MDNLKVGDEVEYVGPIGEWLGTKGIVRYKPTPLTISILITHTTPASDWVNNTEQEFTNSKWEKASLPYDPKQQKDEDDDI